MINKINYVKYLIKKLKYPFFLLSSPITITDGILNYIDHWVDPAGEFWVVFSSSLQAMSLHLSL